MFQFATSPQTKKQLLKDSIDLYKKSFWRTVPFVFLWLFLIFSLLLCFHFLLQKLNIIDVVLSNAPPPANPIEKFQILKPVELGSLSVLFFILGTYIWFLLPVYSYHVLNQIGLNQKTFFFRAFKITFTKFFILLGTLISYSLFILLVEIAILAITALVILIPSYLFSLVFLHSHQIIITWGFHIFWIISAVLTIAFLFYVTIPFSFSFISILFDGTGPISVIKKTLGLVRKKWKHAFWTLCLASLVYFALFLIFVVLGLFPFIPQQVLNILQAGCVYILLPWVLSVKMALFYDLKNRKNEKE